jgi:hypothetical protein
VDIVFDVPEASGESQGDDAGVWVQGRRGDFLSDVMDTIPFPNRLSARFQTDKPIYQPGQTLHLRAVVLDQQGKALEGAKVALEIDEEDNERVHTAHLVASRFGVVMTIGRFPLLPTWAPIKSS